MRQFEERIDRILTIPPYRQAPQEKQAELRNVLKEELDHACQKNVAYRNYIQHWPVDYRSAGQLADLPFLPVGVLKADPPLSLVAADEIKRTLISSATTSQRPSRVVLDSQTARRMARGIVVIVRDFIGPARRPYLVVDTPGYLAEGRDLGARGAAIQGLQPFASEATYCLGLDRQGELKVSREQLYEFASEFRESEVLVYGFTFVLWNYLIKPLLAEGLCLNLPKAQILHSGGWKRLEDQAVGKTQFNQHVAQIFGCSPGRIVDFYGMVESVGVIFPDCTEGNKHAPAFSEVLVRDALTLEPVAPGQIGIVQICSILPTSFPGNLLLTEDMAEVIAYDGCHCGRRGISFRFAGRIPKAELRGCGNLQIKREPVN